MHCFLPTMILRSKSTSLISTLMPKLPWADSMMGITTVHAYKCRDAAARSLQLSSRTYLSIPCLFHVYLSLCNAVPDLLDTMIRMHNGRANSCAALLVLLLERMLLTYRLSFVITCVQVHHAACRGAVCVIQRQIVRFRRPSALEHLLRWH